jgi:D-xylose 1-dehydrogenase (NADP+, D-xylono-1,5-lactone-forming)
VGDRDGPGADAAVQFGVLGATSRIAQKAVLPALRADPSCAVAATASLSSDDYDRFGAARTYRSYQDLLDDPSVEAVYVPLPNSMHEEWTLKAADAGKHVLCEKPLAATPAAAGRMAKGCEDASVCLMEAYMTPFHPRSEALARALAGGELGELRFGFASFTFSLQSPDHRWRRDMGGGALLDVGIYCLAPLLLAAGRGPRELMASAVMREDVDASFSARLDFGEGFAAAVECSFEAPFNQVLMITGTEGALMLERPFTHRIEDTKILRRAKDGTMDEISCGGADPYQGMVAHFAAQVRGRVESARPPSASIELLELQDRLAATVRG